MGKKVKVGKKRKDKFYKLAKETGYRARSAFKLIQLNRKFQFLETSRVLVDLCAAPGGWLQVASRFMPISSLIVGVDLVTIKPIPNVITLTGDITTDACKQAIKKELHTWKADSVLHDGAPNVGQAWVQDAFSQAQLTLSALRLACQLLKRGGCFITKVFRSKDYYSLMWVFQQLFKKVHATKPQASRNESAEIFVVCMGFLAPDKIDPKFLDSKHIFKDIETETKQNKINLMFSEKRKDRNRAGYPDNKHTLFTSTPVTDFITSENYLDHLASSNTLTFDEDSLIIAKHPLTTEEIKTYCQDIKVLGRKEIRTLIKWRSDIRDFYEQKATASETKKTENDESAGVESDDDEDAAKKKIEEFENEEASERKRQRRKRMQLKRKARERQLLKMKVPDSGINLSEDNSLFSLSTITDPKKLSNVNSGEMMLGDDEDEDKTEAMNLDSKNDTESDFDSNDSYSDDDDEESRSDTNHSDNITKTIGDKKSSNPLIIEMPEERSLKQKTNMWFSKNIFKEMDNDQDEELDFQQSISNLKGDKYNSWKEDPKMDSNYRNKSNGSPSKGESLSDTTTTNVRKVVKSDDDDSDESDSDSDYDYYQGMKNNTKTINNDSSQLITRNDFEIAPVENTIAPKYLSPEGLAIGALAATSKKRKEEFIDNAYNRYTFNDENLPDWFTEYEKKHYQKQIPLTKEEIQEQKKKLQEINARPIKKVAEAKARKKMKTLRKVERMRKKAEAILDTSDATDREKMLQIKSIYKKAGVGKAKKSEKQYVVGRKNLGKKRPPGVKGRYKMVDKRLKKDKRASNKKNRK
ncbi:pre-rRNA processing protein FTSJ3 [Trichoplax sp. H2]|nr:pre-rRNA processing protein FTSJ3 [Trichoplax sp. H2]|eukprot:RDD47506.1 pre-rRNA processing protein FTSJ3 [Trichoplax sp. H2]